MSHGFHSKEKYILENRSISKKKKKKEKKSEK